MRTDTKALVAIADVYEHSIGSEHASMIRQAADELADTAPLSREELEGVLKEAGLEKTNNKNTSHEWEVRYIQFHEYRGVTIIDEPDGSISISATYDKGIANPLRKVFRMPPTRRLLRDCGVIA